MSLSTSRVTSCSGYLNILFQRVSNQLDRRVATAAVGGLTAAAVYCSPKIGLGVGLLGSVFLLITSEKYKLEQNLESWCAEVQGLPEYNKRNHAYYSILSAYENSNTRLDLANQGLSSLPDCIGTLVSLKEVNLSGNCLNDLPESFGKLLNLEILLLDKNEMTKIPSAFSKLIGLKRLSLSHNKLTYLPDLITNLVSLEFLALGNNKLEFLPETFGNLIELNSLDLSDNHFVIFPYLICKLFKLKFLDLENNTINCIPESISKLVELYKLNLNNNKLTHLPNSIGDSLVNLRRFYLKNNPLCALPVFHEECQVVTGRCNFTRNLMLSKGVISLKEPHPDFTGRTKELEEINLILKKDGRVTLYGSAGAGKTELAVKYAEDHLNEYDLVWTISCTTPTDKEKSYRDLAKVLGIPLKNNDTLQHVTQQVNFKLEHQDGKKLWLLIYDNLNFEYKSDYSGGANKWKLIDPALESFPKQGGHIIITSREKNQDIAFLYIPSLPEKNEWASNLLDVLFDSKK